MLHNRLMQIVMLVLLLLYGLALPVQAQLPQAALNELGYTVIRTGTTTLPDGETGTYQLLRHAKNKTHALIAKFGGKWSLLDWRLKNPEEAFHHIFTTSVRPGVNMGLSVQARPNWKAAGHRLPVTTMRATFPEKKKQDGSNPWHFSEPDVITSFATGEHRYVLMMGAPQLGLYAHCPMFEAEFGLIKSQMARLVQAIHQAEAKLETRPYSKWSLYWRSFIPRNIGCS